MGSPCSDEASHVMKALGYWARKEGERIRARWASLTPEQLAEFYRRNPKLAVIKARTVAVAEACQGPEGVTR